MEQPADKQRVSVQIRERATEDYVAPAREQGRRDLVIPVRELMGRFPAAFSKNRQSVFCTALRAKSFLEPNGLSLQQVEGPEKQRGTSVIYHYRFEQEPGMAARGPMSEEAAGALADNLLAPLRGKWKKELAAFGGTDALMRWLRSDEPTV